MNLINIFNKNKSKAKTIKVYKATNAGKKVKPKNAIKSVRSFISCYYGYKDCMYGIVGYYKNTSSKYKLNDWINACNDVIKYKGWITPAELIVAGVVTKSIIKQHDKSMLPYSSTNLDNINKLTTIYLKKIPEIYNI